MADPTGTPPQFTPEAIKQIFIEALNSPQRSPADSSSYDMSDDDHSNNIFKPRTQLPRTPALTPSFTAYQPDSPSPLRHVINGENITVGSENSSPSLPRLPPTPTNTYEVPGAFLNAMVGLLERQANIVPEHLYTKKDLREAEEAVRKEMREEEATRMREKQNAVALSSASETGTFTESTVAALGSVALIAIGAGIGMFSRACLAHPELTWHYANGAGKGAMYGLVTVLFLKGMRETFDGTRGFYF